MNNITEQFGNRLGVNENDRVLIAQLPQIEHGQALFRWLRDEISLLDEESGLKICDDPLIEDFRVKMGIKIGLKRVLNKPKECLADREMT